MQSLKGKIVLITGASGGIGAGCAEEFAKYDCKLILTGRNSEKLQQVAENCAKVNEQLQVLTVTGDLTKADDVKSIVASAIQKFGSINILVNNAGRFSPKTFENSAIEDFDEMYDVNVRSVVQITKLCLPYIIESKGNIVNVSSMAGERPNYYCLPSAISKAAISHFTKCLALELAPKEVRVNAISPSVVATDIFTKSGFCEPHTFDQLMMNYSALHPLGRVGKVVEASKAIAFLASDAASFTTGVVFPLDGGRGLTVKSPAL